MQRGKNLTTKQTSFDNTARAVEKGGKGVSYPWSRSVGGAPRSLRIIFLSPFTGIQKLIIQNFKINFALLNDICTGQLL